MAATDPELPLVLEDDVAVRLRIEEQAEVTKLSLSYSTTNYNVVDPRSSEIALLTMSSRRPASLAHQEAGNIRSISCAGYWTLTRSFSKKLVRWRGKPLSGATLAALISSSAGSFAPTNCKAGSSANT